MGEQETITPEQAAYAYAHWWREAGLDCATDEVPRRWRDGEPVPFWRREPSVARAATAPAPKAPIAPADVQPPTVAAEGTRKVEARSPARAPSQMPTSLPAFLDWLAQDEMQPERHWDGANLTLPALATPRIVLIVEMPAAGAETLDQVLEPQQRRFVTAMLAAIGVKPEDAPCLPLALRRPPGSLLDAGVMPQLATRMSHYLDLVRPGLTILLGDRIGRAMLGESWRPGSSTMEKVDLPGGSLDIVSLAGPGLLMNRPLAKAKSWQTLRLLHGTLTQ